MVYFVLQQNLSVLPNEDPFSRSDLEDPDSAKDIFLSFDWNDMPLKQVSGQTFSLEVLSRDYVSPYSSVLILRRLRQIFLLGANSSQVADDSENRLGLLMSATKTCPGQEIERAKHAKRELLAISEFRRSVRTKGSRVIPRSKNTAHWVRKAPCLFSQSQSSAIVQSLQAHTESLVARPPMIGQPACSSRV
jgi:hypothetical protein